MNPGIQTERPASQDSEISEFGELLYQVGTAVRKNLRSELAHYHLTTAQFGALYCLWNNPTGLTVSELADSTHQVAPTMTGILNRLEERGLAARQRNPNDRRNQWVTITPDGKAVLLAFYDQYHENMRGFLSRLEEEDRQELSRLLRQFLAVISEA